MPCVRRPSAIVRKNWLFVGSHAFGGAQVDEFLTHAPAVAEGCHLVTNHCTMELLLNAVGVEVHGFMILEDEEAERARLKPKCHGTAERLPAIYKRIEDHLP